MPIDGKTRLAGVIGCPIAHTRSPAIHNHAARRLGLNFRYLAFLVEPGNLGRALEGVRALGLAGVNVTLPHKQAVMAYLDEVSEESRLIGAVNTVVNKGGRLFGTTTDPYGLRMALKRKKISPKNRRITILGTGGSARTALFSFLLDGCRDIAVAGRRPQKARAMGREAQRRFGREVPVMLLPGRELTRRLAETDLLVNCTSVGMSPLADKTPLHSSLLHKGMAVFDIVYNPVETRLLREAAKKGARVISGVDMLLYQGMAAFRLFTGRDASYSLFYEGFRKA
jgi:shikimate dehydrogenase